MSGFDNDVVYAKNADFTAADNQNVSESNGLITDGQMWVGTTSANAGGTHINVGTLTSPDSSVTVGYSTPNITLQVAGGTTTGKTITGDTGGAITPTVGNWNIVSGVSTINSGSSLAFSGSGSTLTLNTSDASGNTLVGHLSGNATLTGQLNTGFGYQTLSALTSGGKNTAIGLGALFRLTTGVENNAIGWRSQIFNTTGNDNSSLGLDSLIFLTTGSNNTAIGNFALSGIDTGSGNTCLGYQAGNTLNLANSNNIMIGHQGVIGDNNKIRIGTTGSGAGQQSTCFIAGIDGVNVGSVAKVVTEASDQLGTATLTAGTNISITPTANTITIASTGAASFAWSVITANQTIAVNNGYICNKAGTLTLALPATAIVGDLIEVTGINTATGWQITQAANQQIFFGTSSTTLGATGTLTSSAIRDSIKLVCVVAGASTVYNVISSVGNITIV